MIQHDGLNDPGDVEHLPRAIKAAFIPPAFEATVQCAGFTHAITVKDGIPLRGSHDSEEERAMGVLGADAPSCVIARQLIADKLRPVDGVLDSMTPITRTDRLPAPLDRLLELATMRATVVRSHWLDAQQEIARMIRERARRTGATKGSLRGYRLAIRDHTVTRMESDTHVPLANDWLATVWLFGLETIDGDLATAIERRGQEVIATVFRNHRLEQVATMIDGVRFM